MEQQFENIIGKVLLVGVTHYTHDNKIINQEQFWGKVVKANEKQVLLQKDNGEVVSLPPDLRSTRPAPPGEYRLRSTGEIVVNPDYLATWYTVKKQP